MLISKSGHTLLEVMIALILISTSFFSYVVLFRKTFVQVENQYFLNVALNQLFSLHERLSANHDGVYRARELNNWNSENKLLLPEGAGDFSCYRQNCSTKISWKYKTQKEMHIDACIH